MIVMGVDLCSWCLTAGEITLLNQGLQNLHNNLMLIFIKNVSQITLIINCISTFIYIKHHIKNIMESL